MVRVAFKAARYRNLRLGLIRMLRRTLSLIAFVALATGLALGGAWCGSAADISAEDAD